MYTPKGTAQVCGPRRPGIQELIYWMIRQLIHLRFQGVYRDHARTLGPEGSDEAEPRMSASAGGMIALWWR
jgi:hypothetical protein